MSGRIENVTKNKVNSVTSDDSWVICDSSSYPGMKFYVNKVTGIKVWNITDSEIAFAEKAGKDGPEPQRHPIMDRTPRDARIYNKQIINNQFSNQLSNMLVNSVPICPFNVWDNPQNQPPQIQPQQTYTLVPTAFAQAVQQLLPLANSLHNTSLPVSYNSHQYAQNQQTTNRMSRSAKYRKNKWLRERNDLNKTTQNQFGNTHDNSDLRKKLVRRKSCSESFNDHDDYNENRSSTWNEKSNWNDQEWGETSIQMNLSPLKSLASSGSGSDHWYIVVDTDVILKNYNYLNNMTAADTNFHLLIPHHVMSELRMRVLENSNVQDRRTLRFLNDQIESGQAIMGQKEEGQSAAFMIMMTCINLVSDINHVILISDNAETYKYRLITKDIHVFTMQDIKDILANRPTRLPRPNSPTLAVRITVPNDVAGQKLPHEPEKLPETTFHRNFDFTELSEASVCAESVLGVQSVENSRARCSQSPPKSLVKGRNVLINSVVNSKADCILSHSKFKGGYELPHRSAFGVYPENSEAGYKSPSKTVANDGCECSETSILNQNSLGIYSAQNSEGPRNQSPTKYARYTSGSTRSQNALGVYSVQNSEAVRNESPSKSVANECFEFSDGSIPSKSAFGGDSVGNSKAVRNQSPTKSSKSTSGYELTDSSTHNRNALGVHSVQNFEAVRNQSPTKAAANNGYEFSDGSIPGKIAFGMDSVGNSKAVRNQSPNKSAKSTYGYELTDSSIRNQNAVGVDSVQKFEAFRNHSPNKPSKGISGNELTDSSIRSQNALGVYSVQNAEAVRNQSPSKPAKGINVCNKVQSKIPAKMSDDSSLCSSSATSGHVSLDTIRIKRIISMKRLTSTEKSQKVLIEQANSITSNVSKTSIKSTEKPRTSASIKSSSYDNTSDTSANKNVRDNIVVEETSTSVISNSESSHSDKGSRLKDLKKFALRTVVMFEIGGKTMEDVLRTRWDEWVFRFVQVMEEVLRVKLQEKLPFEDKKYPAPRDLQEAARCIIKKFSNNFNVVDAANKLSFILYKMSDEHGNIALNVEPSDYMEMYSYGVFLVETFQDMSADCNEKDCKKEKTNRAKEDGADSCSCFEVNTASDSLKKLLYDIQNANLEIFVDHPHDLSTENTNPDSDPCDYDIDTTEGMQVTESSYVQQDETQSDDHVMKKLYNLRSQKRKSQNFEDDVVPPKVTNTGTGTESTFFNSLQLKKTFHTNNSECPTDVKDSIKRDKQNVLKNLYHSTEETQTPDGQGNHENMHNLKIHFSRDEFTTGKSQSKVICNFTVNPDIERRVQARLKEKEDEEDYGKNHLDYDEDNFEDRIDDEIQPVSESGIYENIIESNSESSPKFKSFMGRLSRRLGDVFTQVKLLCHEYAEEVKSKHFDMTKRNELHHKIEMAYSLIGNILRSLDSISKRDLQDKNIQMLLKIANIQDFIPDDNLILDYRSMINKCKVNTEEIHNIIRNIRG